jgi:drug/metabolite transporter (DMT)-like permease
MLPNPSKPQFKHFLELHFVVILFGFTAILGKLITVSAVAVVFYRTLFATFGLYVLLLALKKSIALKKAEILKLILIGIVVAGHWLLFFGAARVSNVSISLVGLATSSLWVCLLQPILSKTKIRISEILLSIVVILGLMLVLDAEIDHWLGLLMSVGSAVMAALFSIFNSKFTNKYHSLVITFYEMIGSSIVTGIVLIVMILTGSDKAKLNIIPQNMDWLWLGILALVCSVYAYSAIVRLLQNVSAFTINLTTNLEPVYGIILAFFIFGESERMTTNFYTGTLIIFVAVFGYQVFGKRE